MDLILDTHAFIWFVNGDKNLTTKAREVIENPSNFSYISIASLWEMAIKISLGKLEIKYPFEQVLTQIYENGFEILPITFEDTLVISELPFHHRDPFDRLIVAQAMTEGMTIISKDKSFDDYKVTRLW
ncbi:MAG: type II toxin-antitoxin system VapC family toxin [Candidatus Poribacteria bacterium]